MPPISFSDEEIELLSALAAALQPAVRGTFLTIVGNALAAYPTEARGPGLLHRIAAAAQREFVSAPVAIGVGGKHGRAQPQRRGRRLP